MSLAAIVQAGPNPYYMTAIEGQDLATRGFISVNPNSRSPINPEAVQVSLTALGFAEYNRLMAMPAATVATNGSSTGFTLRSDVQVPEIPKRGNPNLTRTHKATYPFDNMEVNQSFHIPCSEKNPEPWKKIASSVSAVNAKSHVPANPPQMELKKVRTLCKTPDGQNILDANGKKTYTETTVQTPVTVATKKFKAFETTAADPDGLGCRVFRVS